MGAKHAQSKYHDCQSQEKNNIDERKGEEPTQRGLDFSGGIGHEGGQKATWKSAPGAGHWGGWECFRSLIEELLEMVFKKAFEGAVVEAVEKLVQVLVQKVVRKAKKEEEQKKAVHGTQILWKKMFLCHAMANSLLHFEAPHNVAKHFIETTVSFLKRATNVISDSAHFTPSNCFAKSNLSSIMKKALNISENTLLQ